MPFPALAAILAALSSMGAAAGAGTGLAATGGALAAEAVAPVLAGTAGTAALAAEAAAPAALAASQAPTAASALTATQLAPGGGVMANAAGNGLGPTMAQQLGAAGEAGVMNTPLSGASAPDAPGWADSMQQYLSDLGDDANRMGQMSGGLGQIGAAFNRPTDVQALMRPYGGGAIGANIDPGQAGLMELMQFIAQNQGRR